MLLDVVIAAGVAPATDVVVGSGVGGAGVGHCCVVIATAPSHAMVALVHALTHHLQS